MGANNGDRVEAQVQNERIIARAILFVDEFAQAGMEIPYSTANNDNPTDALINLIAAFVAFCAVIDNATIAKHLGHEHVPGDPLTAVSTLSNVVAGNLQAFAHRIVEVREACGIPTVENGVAHIMASAISNALADMHEAGSVGVIVIEDDKDEDDELLH